MKKQAKILGIALGAIGFVAVLAVVFCSVYFKDTVIYNKQFRVTEKDGAYILQFNGEVPTEPYIPGVSASTARPHIDFASMAEMKQDIQSGGGYRKRAEADSEILQQG